MSAPDAALLRMETVIDLQSDAHFMKEALRMAAQKLVLDDTVYPERLDIHEY